MTRPEVTVINTYLAAALGLDIEALRNTLGIDPGQGVLDALTAAHYAVIDEDSAPPPTPALGLGTTPTA